MAVAATRVHDAAREVFDAGIVAAGACCAIAVLAAIAADSPTRAVSSDRVTDGDHTGRLS